MTGKNRFVLRTTKPFHYGTMFTWATVVALIPARTDTKWWHGIVSIHKVVFR